MVACTVHTVLTRSKPYFAFRTLVTPYILIVRGSLAEARWILLVDSDVHNWLVFLLLLVKDVNGGVGGIGLVFAPAHIGSAVAQHTVQVNTLPIQGDTVGRGVPLFPVEDVDGVVGNIGLVKAPIQIPWVERIVQINLAVGHKAQCVFNASWW